MTAVLEAQELYKFFHVGDEEIKALRGVDLTLEPGEFVALMGPSGSGKSTLLACLAGIDEPDGGTVRAAGAAISRRPEIERTRLRAIYFGILLQSENLVSHLTVLENVALVQSILPGPIAVRAEDILAKLGLGQRMESLPAELSGGERARAGLAVALANTPPILLLDEPTGEVDAATEEKILSVLHDLADEGTAILVATHNAAVSKAAQRIVKMKDGKRVEV